MLSDTIFRYAKNCFKGFFILVPFSILAILVIGPWLLIGWSVNPESLKMGSLFNSRLINWIGPLFILPLLIVATVLAIPSSIVLFFAGVFTRIGEWVSMRFRRSEALSPLLNAQRDREEEEARNERERKQEAYRIGRRQPTPASRSPSSS